VDRVRARHDRSARRNAPRGVGRAQAAVLAAVATLALGSGEVHAQATGHDHDHDHGHGHTSAPGTPPPELALSEETREMASRLIVQDFRGRMKPLDTLARETVMKVTKGSSFEGRHPIDVFLGFAVFPEPWYDYPTIVVKNPGVKEILGVSESTEYVSIGSLLTDRGYKLQDQAEAAHRTPPNQRDKTTQRLISFDERVHILYSALQGTSLRIFPIPDDPKDKWEGIQTVLQTLGEDDPRHAEFQAAADDLFLGLQAHDSARIREGLRKTAALQQKYGAEVMPEDFRVDAELQLNRLHPFEWSTLPYGLGFLLLIIAYFWGLFRRDEKPWKLREPLYGVGMLLFLAAFLLHTYGFVLRWVASARAPLSNGHESLLWVALSVALAGLIFELASRTAAAGALGSLLSALVLGVSFMSAFDPAIGPLVPVLASYWLNIHVTVITASYGFLGLCALLGALTMILLVITGLTRRPLGSAIAKLDRLNVDVMVVGLGLLAIGTLLGGVWANESWGRYWGWDPKETWALVAILAYALLLHFRWIPKLSNVYVQAAGSFLAIWVIIMTYFGVNYLLAGLHSYAAGDAVTIPTWIVALFAGMVALCVIGWFAWRESRPTLAIAASELQPEPGQP
jgi:cytochrome c-type biogenesis protein CcsB